MSYIPASDSQSQRSCRPSEGLCYNAIVLKVEDFDE